LGPHFGGALWCRPKIYANKPHRFPFSPTIGVEDGGGGGGGGGWKKTGGILKYLGTCEIIRALNLGKDLFF